MRTKGMALLVALMVSAISLSLVAGPAQEILAGLADEAKAERIVGAYVSIGTGLAVGVASAVFLTGTGYELYGYLAGGLIAAPGVLALVTLSPTEQAYAQAGDSETLSALALEGLAGDARRERYLSGILNVAAGVASLVYPLNFVTAYDYLYSSLASFGMAVMDFLFPSKEELAYSRYQKLADASG